MKTENEIKSFVVAKIIAECRKPFTDEEFAENFVHRTVK